MEDHAEARALLISGQLRRVQPKWPRSILKSKKTELIETEK